MNKPRRFTACAKQLPLDLSLRSGPSPRTIHTVLVQVSFLCNFETRLCAKFGPFSWRQLWSWWQTVHSTSRSFRSSACSQVAVRFCWTVAKRERVGRSARRAVAVLLGPLGSLCCHYCLLFPLVLASVVALSSSSPRCTLRSTSIQRPERGSRLRPLRSRAQQTRSSILEMELIGGEKSELSG